MQNKTIIFIADSLDNAHKFQGVLNEMDVRVFAGSSLQFKNLLASHPDASLVIYEIREENIKFLPDIEKSISEYANAHFLAVVPENLLEKFRLPVQVKSDFVVAGATDAECSARVYHLLWPGAEDASTDVVVVDNMAINLATYQVTIDGEVLDLTYLEYALLSFLATHPGRTYSRDALLRRVWGFDYYGGSRTVDVHIRRVRAKLGPALSERIETVRGVGYLWKA